MEINSEAQKMIQELQVLEQNLQQQSMQMQAFQLELNETESALSEIGKSKEDVYRIVGSIMLKAEKSELGKELKEKKDILNLRLSSIEKHENLLREKAEKLRESLMKSMKKE